MNIEELRIKGDGFEGWIATLAINIRFSVVPNPEPSSDEAPDYLIFAGKAQLGAAWKRQIRAGVKEGHEYLSMLLDDPSWPAGLNVAAFPSPSDPELSVVAWNRREKPDAELAGDGAARPRLADPPPPASEQDYGTARR